MHSNHGLKITTILMLAVCLSSASRSAFAQDSFDTGCATRPGSVHFSLEFDVTGKILPRRFQNWRDPFVATECDTTDTSTPAQNWEQGKEKDPFASAQSGSGFNGYARPLNCLTSRPCIYKEHSPHNQYGTYFENIKLLYEKQRDWSWKSVPPFTKRMRIVFNDPPNARDLKLALAELNLTGSQILPVAARPLLPAEANIEQVNETIAHLRHGFRPTKAMYAVVAPGNDGKLQDAGALPKIEIHTELGSTQVLEEVYNEAARRNLPDADRAFYKGAGDVMRQDWDNAMLAFHRAEQESAKENRNLYLLYKDILQCYRQSSVCRPREISDWLLKVAHTTNNPAECREAYSEAERLIITPNPGMCNAAWDAGRMPIKVFIGGRSAPDFDERLIYQFRQSAIDWSTASGHKIDFTFVDDRTTADLVCEWSKPHTDAEIVLRDRLHVPESELATGVLGETSVATTRIDGTEIDHVLIQILSHNPRMMSDQHLRAIVLHEVGHALGIRRHLDSDRHCVMYPSLNISNFNLEITPADQAAIAAIYASQPVCQSALMKFVVLPAATRELPPPAEIITKKN